MKKITLFFLTLVMCLGVSFSVFAYEDKTLTDFCGFPVYIDEFPDEFKAYANDVGNSPYCIGMHQLNNNFSVLYYSNLTEFRLYKTSSTSSLASLSVSYSYSVKVGLSSGVYESSSTGIGSSGLHKPDSVYIGNMSSIKYGVTPSYTEYVIDSGGGSSSQETAYDSTIPAPQNLKLDFVKTKVGILGLSQRTDMHLSWSNALVNDYSARISASIRVEGIDTEPSGSVSETHTKKTISCELVGFSQLDSGGPDAGFPASTGEYVITEDDVREIAEKQLGDKFIIENVYVDKFRVQFYQINSGVVNVGPVGVVTLNYSFLGKYQGSSVTTEYPSNDSDIGSSGGLMPDDSDKWQGDGSGLEFDADGNISGSVDPGGGSSGSSGSTIKDLINSLINIPTVLNQFFSSLQALLSGVGSFPAFLSQIMSWLPSDIISIIALGISVVIVLRIVGR